LLLLLLRLLLAALYAPLAEGPDLHHHHIAF